MGIRMKLHCVGKFSTRCICISACEHRYSMHTFDDTGEICLLKSSVCGLKQYPVVDSITSFHCNFIILMCPCAI